MGPLFVTIDLVIAAVWLVCFIQVFRTAVRLSDEFIYWFVGMWICCALLWVLFGISLAVT